MSATALVSPTVVSGQRWRELAEVLDDNWVHDHTVPSHSLYPHQWSWDSGFVAIGLAHHRPERAFTELRTLFEAQWPDGRVPHIVFDPTVSDHNYFPGPAFWTAPGSPARATTTGVVQPPVHALGAWAAYRADPDRLDDLAWLYPRLVAAQRYLSGPRDVAGAGLSAIVHPWESGLDNSPAWDQALAGVPADPAVLRRYERRDTAVTASHRPTDADYARYITLAESYRDGGYRDSGLLDRHQFLVECPAFNAISGAAELALADIAGVVGADPAPHRANAARISAAIARRLYNPATGLYHALDLRTGRRSPAYCVSGLIPLILPDLPADQVESVVAQSLSPRFGLDPWPAPSYDRTAPDFDELRYWRGPVWANVNWLIWRGLRTHGRAELAAGLRQRLLSLIRDSGCYEYFHPATGAGLGSGAFSWTAALGLDLLAASA